MTSLYGYLPVLPSCICLCHSLCTCKAEICSWASQSYGEEWQRERSHISSWTTAASTAKQSRKRMTELKKATNKKKLNTTRSKVRVNIGVVFGGAALEVDSNQRGGKLWKCSLRLTVSAVLPASASTDVLHFSSADQSKGSNINKQLKISKWHTSSLATIGLFCLHGANYYTSWVRKWPVSFSTRFSKLNRAGYYFLSKCFHFHVFPFLETSQ